MSQPSDPALPSHVAGAARRLLRKAGAEGLTMDALAREAGLSRATLYRVVGSRADVLAALSEQGLPVGARPAVRERALAACRVVFARAGFDAATLEEVALEAGLGVATLYRHFKDKEGLIAAFADQLGPRRALRELTLKPSGDLRADLERVGAAVIRQASADVDLLRLALLERLRGGRWAELMKASPMRTLPMLSRLLKPYADSGALASEDPGRMAQAFGGMLMSFFVRAALDDSPLPDPEETARFITRVFLDGLAAGGRT
jgi:AcrR family transcriptional regulator